MSASDIPEMHDTPRAMARCLASYIDCPDKIYRRVKAEYGSSPDRVVIKQMRASHLKPPTPVPACKPHDGYYPGDAAESLAKTNAEFLVRLQDERTLSLAMRDYRKRVPALVE